MQRNFSFKRLFLLFTVFVFGFLFLGYPQKTFAQQSRYIYVGHNEVALFDQIPPEWKAAAANLHMFFMDRSVGGNVHEGLDCLAQPYASSPNYCRSNSTETWTGTYDRSNWYYAYWNEYPSSINPSAWYDKIRYYMDIPNGLANNLIVCRQFCTDADPNNDVFYEIESFDFYQVMSFQYSYLAVDGTLDPNNPGLNIAGTNGYFVQQPNNSNNNIGYDVYDQRAFESQYPNRVFIYWTSSLARIIGTNTATVFNNQMRQFAQTNNLPLFDFADIESHAPDGTPCVYTNGEPNLCADYTSETVGGHLGSMATGMIRVAKAYWVLMAQIAGWNPSGVPLPTPTPQPSIIPSPLPSPTLTPSASPVPSPAPSPLPDANGDGQVTSADFLIWQSHFSENTTAGIPFGDFNQNGKVETLDFGDWYSHYSPGASPLPSGNTSLHAGTGSVQVTNTEWQTHSTDVEYISTNYFQPAIQSARTRFGQTNPTTILYISNMGNQARLIQDIQAQFPGVPIGGVANTTADYNAFTQDVFNGGGNRAVAIMALGGTSINNITMFQTPLLGSGNPTTDNLIDTGRALATLYMPQIDPNQQNVILMLGGGHTPRLVYFMCGMKEILTGNNTLCRPADPNASPSPNPGLTTPIPQLTTHFIGAAGNDGASTTANTTSLNNSLTAVLIQGNFSFAERGIGIGFTDPIGQSQTSLQQIVTELGGNPDLLFYIPGHPDDPPNNVPMEDMRTAAYSILAPGTPLFGHEGGGEYGHVNTLNTNGTNVPYGISNFAFYAGLKGN